MPYDKYEIELLKDIDEANAALTLAPVIQVSATQRTD